jgi:hypothetical protein
MAYLNPRKKIIMEANNNGTVQAHKEFIQASNWKS